MGHGRGRHADGPTKSHSPSRWEIKHRQTRCTHCLGRSSTSRPAERRCRLAELVGESSLCGRGGVCDCGRFPSRPPVQAARRSPFRPTVRLPVRPSARSPDARHPSESWDIPVWRTASARWETPAFAGVTGSVGSYGSEIGMIGDPPIPQPDTQKGPGSLPALLNSQRQDGSKSRPRRSRLPAPAALSPSRD